MDDPLRDDVQALRDVVAALTRRVYALEQRLGTTAAPAPAAPSPTEAAPTPLPAAPDLPTSAPATSSSGGEMGLESRIGSHWLNRIGIVAVLIGVSYFLKYAFENNWIGPAGRVVIGLLAGIGVVLWSERFRSRGYRWFSWSLQAVGIGVLYLSLWAAFQLYHLVPAGAAFGAMIVVTAATATMALRQDAEVLAAFALAGGFATPLLVSTGENHEITLFAYVAMLNLGTLALIAFRPWQRLIFGAFVGTVVLYVGWDAAYYTEAQLAPTAAFATLFFVIFSAAPLLAARSATEPHSVEKAVVVLPLLNAGVYFLELFAMLEQLHHGALAWCALALAAVYIGISRAAGTSADQRLLRLLHLSLAVAFVTIAIPLKLEAHWITLGWLVESGLLLWIGQRTRTQLLLYLGMIALALGIFRLVAIDDFHPQHALVNMRFGCYLLAVAILLAMQRLGTVVADERQRGLLAFAAVVANVLALIALSCEVRDTFARALADRRGTDAHRLFIARDFSYSALYMAYGALLMFLGFWRRSAFLRWQALVLIALTVGKVFIYDVSELDRGYRILSFIVLGVLLLAISFAYQHDWFQLARRGQEAPERRPGRESESL